MSKKSHVAPASFPGFEYLQRVTVAWNEAMLDQARSMQGLWDSMRTGDFKLEQLAQAWVSGVESYYGVALEATRSNSERPVWLVVPFKKSEPNGTLEYPIALERLQPDETQAEASPFTDMRAGGLLELQPKDEIFSQLKVVGRRLAVRLNPEVVKTVPAGEYMSFVFVASRGAQPPLAIVVLTVTD